MVRYDATEKVAQRGARTAPKWGAIALGAVLGGLGAVAIAASVSAKTSRPLQPLPPQPSTDPMLALVTDPETVWELQAIFADVIANPAKQFGLNPSDYTRDDVDGNPNNPRFMRALAVFQLWVNGALPGAIAAGKMPPGYPTQLRTDGVLDRATVIAVAKA